MHIKRSKAWKPKIENTVHISNHNKCEYSLNLIKMYNATFLGLNILQLLLEWALVFPLLATLIDLHSSFLI